MSMIRRINERPSKDWENPKEDEDESKTEFAIEFEINGEKLPPQLSKSIEWFMKPNQN